MIFSKQLKDPGKPGALWFNTFLKKDEFLPEVGKPLLPSSLRNLHQEIFLGVRLCKVTRPRREVTQNA